MLAAVTNKAKSSRGFHTLDRGSVPIEPGAHALLDLADHPLHRAWADAGEISIVPLSDKDAKAVRKKLDADADALDRSRVVALSALPGAFAAGS
ncbi:hypothetical protein LGH83_15615 [Lichenihabitans sp. PAMC28606]|uniref:hypothetical protein n=1 Tax=Lichenihabitans sp. PAMC28606 TaxID=2880932 RepID=UPI001D0BA97A|nr:hypothetical protein [Lichenihabitans sp. PAMC28606]UDL93970.1 hypothetical protein LGH83_15615 [Lichenihabitans sp. PAMC28606]